MNKYLIILTAPSMHLMNQSDNFIEPYVVKSTEEDIGNYVDNFLTRKFALDYKVPLADVRILAASIVK